MVDKKSSCTNAFRVISYITRNKSLILSQVKQPTYSPRHRCNFISGFHQLDWLF